VRDLKIRAAKENTTMTALVVAACRAYLKK